MQWVISPGSPFFVFVPDVRLLGVKRTSGESASMSAYDAVGGARSAASKCYKLVASKPERFKEVRPGNDDGVLKFWRNWRGHDDVMQTRSIRGSGEPAWVIASLNAYLRLGPDPRRALWPAATSAAQTGRTHDRTRPMLAASESSCQGGAVHT